MIVVERNRNKQTSKRTVNRKQRTEDQQRHLVQDHRRGNEYGTEPKQANIEPNVETIDLHPTNTETLPDSPDVNRVSIKRSTLGKDSTRPFVFLFFRSVHGILRSFFVRASATL